MDRIKPRTKPSRKFSCIGGLWRKASMRSRGNQAKSLVPPPSPVKNCLGRRCAEDLADHHPLHDESPAPNPGLRFLPRDGAREPHCRPSRRPGARRADAAAPGCHDGPAADHLSRHQGRKTRHAADRVLHRRRQAVHGGDDLRAQRRCLLHRTEQQQDHALERRGQTRCRSSCTRRATPTACASTTMAISSSVPTNAMRCGRSPSAKPRRSPIPSRSIPPSATRRGRTGSPCRSTRSW